MGVRACSWANGGIGHIPKYDEIIVDGHSRGVTREARGGMNEKRKKNERQRLKKETKMRGKELGKKRLRCKEREAKNERQKIREKRRRGETREP